MQYVIQNVRNERISPTLPSLTGIGAYTAPFCVNPLKRNCGLEYESAELMGGVRRRRHWLIWAVAHQLEDEGWEPSFWSWRIDGGFFEGELISFRSGL